MRRILTAAALLVSLLPIPSPAQSMTKSFRVEGTVVSVTANSVVVKTAGGDKTFSQAPNAKYLALSKSSLDKVTQDSFIGTTVVPQPNGTYVSTEVHIFAPSLRGTGEGFTKMDSAGKHMMANATVRTVSETSRMMANSTVRTVSSTAGQKKITMVFASGTKNITIPADTPVTYVEPGSKNALVPGVRVLVIATSSSPNAIAKTIVISKDGTSLM